MAADPERQLLRHTVATLAYRGAKAMRGAEAAFQRITVSDNGSGIAADALPNLFHPFFTTKPQGTGLGLAVVQKIIVQHGGQVEARNRTEGGAAFMVTLPVSAGAAKAVELMKKDIVEI